MDLYPHLEMFEAIPFRPFKNWQQALETLRQRLYVIPDTEKDALLQAMHELLVETPAGYAIKGAKPGFRGTSALHVMGTTCDPQAMAPQWRPARAAQRVGQERRPR